MISNISPSAPKIDRDIILQFRPSVELQVLLNSYEVKKVKLNQKQKKNRLLLKNFICA